MTEPTAHDSRTDGDPAGSPGDRTAGTRAAEEGRDVSDVGLVHPGDDEAAVRGEDATGGAAGADEAALDEVFPAEDR